MNAQPDWRWEKGAVDERKEHIELRYGSAEKTPQKNWELVARIAKPKNHVFIVEWLIKQDSPEHQEMLADARSDLDFYLSDLNKPDPWAYALYHCGSMSNLYSIVHWSYFPNGIQSARRSGVTMLTPEESKKLFGEPGKPGKYTLIKPEGWSESPPVHSEIYWAKIYAKMTIMYPDIAYTISSTGKLEYGGRVPDIIRDLRKVMEAANYMKLPMDVQCETSEIVTYSFSFPEGDHLVALWIRGLPVDDDPGVSATLTFPGYSAKKVIEIEVLQGCE